MNWYSYAPKSWRWETLKTCQLLNWQHLKDKLKKLSTLGNYKNVQGNHRNDAIKNKAEETKNTSIKNHLLVLRYKGLCDEIDVMKESNSAVAF